MKKEHWLYIVIAILAIWIIASYASKPLDNGDVDYNNDTEATTTSMLGTSENSQSANALDSASGMDLGVSNDANVTINVTRDYKVGVSNQSAGSMVILDSVSMTNQGWVVVHESDSMGQPGWMLGAQRFDAGMYTGGSVELLRATVAGGKYYVMIHNDDGDRKFDFHVDKPVMVNGMPVMASFMAN